MEKSKNIRKGIVIGIIVCSLMLVGFLGSYAFFIGQVGQNKNQEVTVETGTMALTFSDGNNGFNKELNFGESAEKTFTIENTGTKEGIVSVSWMNLLNNYLEGSMTYTFLESDTEDGEYIEIVSNKNVPVTEEAEDKVLASGITIPAGVKKYYKLIITLNNTDFDQTEDLQAKLETQFKITEGVLKDPTPAETTLAKLGKTVKDGNLSFAEPAITDETADGLYVMEDDYGISYYYRGAVEDNYVKFAGFYWRIIRINGDGSLRIIYDGTQAHANGTSNRNRLALTNQVYNANYYDAKYLGYMYGPNGSGESTNKEEAQTNTANSNIKVAIENWYKTNIVDKGYDGYISDNIFCNDRRAPGKAETGYGSDTGLGYGKNKTAYGGYARLFHENTNGFNPTPIFTCSQKNDTFTKEDTELGNGRLEQKVGLITADEIVTAGSGKYGTVNKNYYLYKGFEYWSLSPSFFDGQYARVFRVSTDGSLSYGLAYIQTNAVPVINLSAEYVSTLIGDGTMNNPYREEELEP